MVETKLVEEQIQISMCRLMTFQKEPLVGKIVLDNDKLKLLVAGDALFGG